MNNVCHAGLIESFFFAFLIGLTVEKNSDKSYRYKKLYRYYKYR
jgi:hypothetical protein